MRKTAIILSVLTVVVLHSVRNATRKKRTHSYEMQIPFMIRKVFGFLVMLISMTSCAVSTQWYKTLENKSGLNGDLTLLNGIYDNMPDNYNDSIDFNSNPYPLYTLLFEPDRIYKWGEYRSYDGTIKLEVISDKKIKISYIRGDSVRKEKIISGKLKHNIFSVKRRVMFLPFIVFSYYTELKPSIYLDDKGNLVVHNGRYVFMNILLMSGAGDSSEGGRFLRINEKNGITD